MVPPPMLATMSLEPLPTIDGNSSTTLAMASAFWRREALAAVSRIVDTGQRSDIGLNGVDASRTEELTETTGGRSESSTVASSATWEKIMKF